MTLLSVEDLHVHFVTRGLDNRIRTARALNGVSFTVEQGEIVGLVGETGAGKSLTALAAMGLLRPPAMIPTGAIRFDGQNILALPPRELNAIRGVRMTMIVQSPLTSLDPLARVGDQLVRMQQQHSRISRAEAVKRALAVLDEVRVADPERRMRAWPHELSGGMAQRVLIAMALVNRPRLVIADEPTTGLDVTVQAQVLDTLRDLVRANGMSAIIITHDLGVVAHHCDRMAVMFAGTIVEQGRVSDVFREQRHPYTRALISATPKRIAAQGFGQVGGTPPDLYNLPGGCLYRDRCGRATELCTSAPPLIGIGPGHGVLCHHAAEIPAP
ncbi:MAG: ABC transporter ATP-binding protein [Alphaproteobacteria bacterium]|nr:ABC transporter ATP-binding protein [Alphaproteobacteria bacterium]